MKSSRLRFGVLITAPLVVVLYCGARHCLEQQATPETEINKLLIEQRDTYRQLVDAVTTQYRSGTVELDNVIRAKNGLFAAELELAKTKAERIQIFEKQLDNMRELEAANAQRFEAGVATFNQLLESKAARIRAQIKLLREKDSQD